MAGSNTQSAVRYVVTNLPDTASDAAVKRSIEKCFNVRVYEFERLPDATTGLITFEDQGDASKVAQMKPSIAKQPLTLNAMCFEHTSLAMQGRVIEMIGIQTLVQIANDLYLPCSVERDKIVISGYWKTVELFRTEVSKLFTSFISQTFGQTSALQSSIGSSSAKLLPRPFLDTYGTAAFSSAGTINSSHSKLATASTMTPSRTTVVNSSFGGSYLRSVTSAASKPANTSTVAIASTTAAAAAVFSSFRVTPSPAASSVAAATQSSSPHFTTGVQSSVVTNLGAHNVISVLPIELNLVRVDPQKASVSSVTSTSAAPRGQVNSPGPMLIAASIPVTSTTMVAAVSSAVVTSRVTSPPLLPTTGGATSFDSLSESLRSPESVKSKLELISLSNGQTITLKQGDIVAESVDVIVNAANSFLKHEGGVAKAIDAASDGLVQLFSDELVSRDGVIPVGGSKYTQAGGQLKCKYVVHTVGPDARKHAPKECEALLRLACENSLTLAEALKATSVAFPAISAGIFGVDVAIVSRNIIKTLVDFKYSHATGLKDIRIVISDSETFAAFRDYFTRKKSSYDRHKGKRSSKTKKTPMVADHNAIYTQPSHPQYHMGVPTTSAMPAFNSKHRRGGSLDLKKRDFTDTYMQT